jgi:hypothetical protein
MSRGLGAVVKPSVAATGTIGCAREGGKILARGPRSRPGGSGHFHPLLSYRSLSYLSILVVHVWLMESSERALLVLLGGWSLLGCVESMGSSG